MEEATDQWLSQDQAQQQCSAARRQGNRDRRTAEQTTWERWQTAEAGRARTRWTCEGTRRRSTTTTTPQRPPRTANNLQHSRLRQLTVGSRPSDHYFCSVCWFVCLFVCLFVQSFSQPSLIRFRSNMDICYMCGSSCVP